MTVFSSPGRERAVDKRHSVQEQRLQLVTERFATSRGHDHDRIAPGQEGKEEGVYGRGLGEF